MAINVNPKRLRETLTTYQGYLETKPDDWVNLEIVERCLQYLHDPQAQEYFRRATEFYVLVPVNVDSQTVLANLYRLAGEMDQARQHYQQAYDLLMPFDFADRERSMTNEMKLDRLALCAYMLGDDALTIAAVAHLRPLCRKGEWLLCFALAALAEARQQGDVARA
jgi:tetratricopeptide (TPR) repeat protein